MEHVRHLRRRRARVGRRRACRRSGRSGRPRAVAISRTSSSRRSPGAARTRRRLPRTSSLSARSHHHAHGGGVVGVVEDDLERVLVEHVEPAGRLVEARREGAEAVADVVEVMRPSRSRRARRPARRRTSRSGRCASPCPRGRRDEVRPQQRDVPPAVVDRDHLAVHALLQHDGAAARTDVLAHERVLRVHRDVAQVLGVACARPSRDSARRRR